MVDSSRLLFLNLSPSHHRNFHLYIGGAMATKRLKLTFPRELIKEPVIFTMARKFDVMPNIRRAKIAENMGEVVLELEGSESKLEEGIAFLRERGVKVEAVEGDAAE
jgi:L-aspartate semialdehyde sulfurtransferase ferredoxin